MWLCYKHKFEQRRICPKNQINQAKSELWRDFIDTIVAIANTQNTFSMSAINKVEPSMHIHIVDEFLTFVSFWSIVKIKTKKKKKGIFENKKKERK